MTASLPVAAAEHVVELGDVAGDHLDAEVDERRGVRAGAGEGTDMVAPFDQLLGDVGAGEPGGAGDEDGLAHAGASSAAGAIESTWSGE